MLRRWWSKPGASAFIVIVIIYIGLVHYCSVTYYRDPTSAFFDPDRAYERVYSKERQQKADNYIHNANTSTFPRIEKDKVQMCVGISTVKREGNEQYVRSTIGSLMDSLSPAERARIYLTVLIAHTTPTIHPIYGEPWLTNIADKVLLYNVNEKQLQDLKDWEKKNNYRRKAVFDYAFVLQHCVDTGAPWIAIIEDDTVAAGGWYSRAIEALENNDAQRHWNSRPDWLYLRLFFTERFLGWNKEEWPHYLATSAGLAGMNAMILLLVRQFKFERTITNTFVAIACLGCTPAFIALYFLAGRLSMNPLVPGVFDMPNFGCCGQGLVFPRQMATKVVDRLVQKRTGYVDAMLEEYARESDLDRMVMMPSVLQHIGAKSSKEDDFGAQAKSRKTVAESIWNFGFEHYEERL